MADTKSKAAAAAAEPDVNTDPEAFISMKNSSTGGEGRAQRAAFDTIWKDKGWTEIKNTASFDAAPLDDSSFTS